MSDTYSVEQEAKHMTDLGSSGATARTMPHLFNAWYVAAWDYEATSKAILSRTIAGRPLAIYRTESGRPVALADACWHRLAPLSMGERRLIQRMIESEQPSSGHAGLAAAPSSAAVN
jgi:hypothetical protein